MTVNKSVVSLYLCVKAVLELQTFENWKAHLQTLGHFFKV